MNVTKILRQFGQDVMATGFLGGMAGHFIEEDLKARGAHCRFVKIAGETRSNNNIITEKGIVTEILEPGAQPEICEIQTFLTLFEELVPGHEVVVISGGVPAGVPSDIYEVMIRIAKNGGAKVFLDTSEEWLRGALDAGPYLIKPNEKEAAYLMGLPEVPDLLEDRERLLALYNRLKVKHMLVSLGERGIVWAAPEQMLLAVPPKLDIVNTVGCGDSVMASLVMSYMKKSSVKESLCGAVALSAASVMSLENGQVDLGLYAELLKEVEFKELWDIWEK